MYHMITKMFNSIVGHLFLIFFLSFLFLFLVVEVLIITLMANEHEDFGQNWSNPHVSKSNHLHAGFLLEFL